MAHSLKLANLVAALLLPCLFTSDCLATQHLNSLEAAEQWEAIAKIRLQLADDHERMSENRATGDGQNSLDTGDLLNLAGDDKFLAAENYQSASRHWDKAATAYTSAGASESAKTARDKAKTAIALAKRALHDGVQSYIKAKEQYERTNVLDKKMAALDKIARNLERLMEMK